MLYLLSSETLEPLKVRIIVLNNLLWAPSPSIARNDTAPPPPGQNLFPHQGNLIQGKAQVTLKNWENLLGDQREDSLTSLAIY